MVLLITLEKRECALLVLVCHPRLGRLREVELKHECGGTETNNKGPRGVPSKAPEDFAGICTITASQGFGECVLASYKYISESRSQACVLVRTHTLPPLVDQKDSNSDGKTQLLDTPMAVDLGVLHSGSLQTCL